MSTRKGAEEANRESRETAQSRDLHEMKDRLRRMETRLVKLFEHLGLDTERKLPVFKTNLASTSVEVPSMLVALEDILRSIPEQYGLPVAIRHKGVTVAQIVRE